MLVFSVLACMKTAQFAPPAEPILVTVEAAQGEPDENGRVCNWEEESLWYGANRLLGTEQPGGSACGGADDHWQILDIVAKNGHFVSIERSWGACCPATTSRDVFTWDVLAGRPVTIVEYDEKWGEKRLQRARKAVQRGAFPGLADPAIIDPRRFYIRGPGVVFVAEDALGHRVDVPVK